MSQDKRDHKRKRGARNRRRASSAPQVSWEAIDSGIIKQFVLLAERLDGAVRFGRNRGGDVFAIGFYAGDEKWTEWIRHDDDVNAELERIFAEIQEDFDCEM